MKGGSLPHRERDGYQDDTGPRSSPAAVEEPVRQQPMYFTGRKPRLSGSS